MAASYRIYRNGDNVKFRWWLYNIEDYSNPENDISKQIAINNALKDELHSSGNYSGYKYCDDTVKILTFIEEKGLLYEEIAEGATYDGDARSQTMYPINLAETLLTMNTIIIFILICEITNIGRMNGAYISEMIIWGRKKLYKRELLAGLLFTNLIILFEFLLITALRNEFIANTKYYIYIFNENVVAVSAIMEYILLLLSVWLRIILMYFFFFSLSQLVLNPIRFLLIAVGISVIMEEIVKHLSNVKIKTIYECHIGWFYRLDFEPAEFFGIKLIKLVVVLMLTITAYIVSQKRNLKTQY